MGKHIFKKNLMGFLLVLLLGFICLVGCFFAVSYKYILCVILAVKIFGSPKHNAMFCATGSKWLIFFPLACCLMVLLPVILPLTFALP